MPKVAVTLLAVASVILIAGAVIDTWQYGQEGKSDRSFISPDEASLPLSLTTDFYGYLVGPTASRCIETHLAERSLWSKVKDSFVSKKRLVGGLVALCETERVNVIREQKEKEQQKALALAQEKKKRQEAMLALEKEKVSVIEQHPFTVSWLSTPKELADISLLNDAPYDEVSYFEMGSTSNGDIVIYSIGGGAMMVADISRWIKTSDGKFVLLEKQSDLAQGADFLFDSVAVENGKLARDLVSEIPGIDVPDEFEYRGTRWIRQGSLFASDITPIDRNFEKPNHNLARVSFGELYSKEKKNSEDQSIGSVSYFVRIADGFYLNYKMDDSRVDDGTLLADWKSKYGNFQQLSFTEGSINGGCGTVGDNRYYPKSGEVESMENVGMLKTGAPLYLIKDANNAVVGTFYSEYLSPLSYSNSSPMSRSDFFQHIKVLLAPDPLGRGYLFYKYIDDDSLIQGAECAKPVIYLYPEKTEDISVKVGAHITKSEPEYGSSWKVIAEPDGTIYDEDGKEWQNLFWDGTGYGEYPTIQEGHVVPRSNIREAIADDLLALGLNEKERSDFLEFWMPHMPNTPYIRLTWLTTSDMNTLAPIEVVPRPDTVIRVFLDFSGQQSTETDLQPQILSAIPRKGFTLVEWGGLLHSSRSVR